PPDAAPIRSGPALVSPRVESRGESMRTRTRMSTRWALAAGTALALSVQLLLPNAGNAASGESLSVDLSSTRGASTGVGEGFLYGVSQDGTQPADQYLAPLHITAYRGGG